MKDVNWKIMVLGIALGAVFYCAMVIAADAEDVANAMEAFDWIYLLPVLALVLANYFVRGERWHNYLQSIGLSLPRRRSHWLFLSGLAMSVTPGKLGEAVKAMLLRLEKGAPVERGLAVVLAERISDAIGILILIGVGTMVTPYGVLSSLIVLAAVLCVLAVIISRRSAAAVVRLFISREGLKRIWEALRTALEDSRHLLTGRNLAFGSAYSTVAWAAECVAFFIILQACSLDVGIMESVFIYSFSSIVGAVSMLPGGMGTTEASMLGLLILHGLSAPEASFAVVLTRVCTLWFAVGLGIVFLTAYTRRR